MIYPSFFQKVDSITLYDPLADFLGAIEGGRIEITYLDLVKFAGHSCPTVAGAYLMTKIGLEHLFQEALPIRGEIKVFIKGKKDEGVNGVIGNSIAYICGVSDEAGFKGIGGKFARAYRLEYGAKITGEVRLQRLDNGAYVDLSYDPSIVPPDPKMKTLMAKLQSATASMQDRKEFQRLWQTRVEKILLAKELWGQLVKLH